MCTQTVGVMENSKVNKVKKLVFWGKGGQTYAQIIIYGHIYIYAQIYIYNIINIINNKYIIYKYIYNIYICPNNYN